MEGHCISQFRKIQHYLNLQYLEKETNLVRGKFCKVFRKKKLNNVAEIGTTFKCIYTRFIIDYRKRSREHSVFYYK